MEEIVLDQIQPILRLPNDPMLNTSWKFKKKLLQEDKKWEMS